MLVISYFSVCQHKHGSIPLCRRQMVASQGTPLIRSLSSTHSGPCTLSTAKAKDHCYFESKLLLLHAWSNFLKRHSHRTFPQLSSAKKEALPARFSIDLLYKTDLAKSIFRFDRCSTPWCVPRTFLDPATTRILRDEY